MREEGGRSCVRDLATDKEDMIGYREGKGAERSGAGAGSAECFEITLVAVIVRIFAVCQHLMAH